MAVESGARAARRHLWRRVVAAYVVGVMAGVLLAVAYDSVLIGAIVTGFALSNLGVLWFVLFKTAPTGDRQPDS